MAGQTGGSWSPITSQSLPGVTCMLQLSTHVSIVGVGPGGQILISSVTGCQALAGHSVLENCSL